MTLCYVPRLGSTDPSAPGSGDGASRVFHSGGKLPLPPGQAGVRPLLREEQGEPRVCDGGVGSGPAQLSPSQTATAPASGREALGLDGDRR